MTTVVFYISGHGFGHASRVIEVINAVVARRGDLDIVVRTTAPRWLFERTLKPGLNPGPTTATPGVAYSSTETDTGIVQIDSLHLDADASVERARSFMASFDERVAREAAFLRDRGARLAVADLPPLGIAAAAAAGIPAVGLGNFTWDWVYSAYPGTADLVSAIADAYRTAQVALRLPMHGGFDAFETIVDLPFVARRSARDPDQTRRALGLPPGERLVLGFRSSTLRNVVFLDETGMYAAGFRYEDLVRAVDVVATKPGYGIISECLANETALLYTSRGHFVEYDVLVAAMPSFLRAGFIDHADLFAGRWTPHLDRLLSQPAPPERPATNGAEIAADHLLARL
jgi:hypothetical protein